MPIEQPDFMPDPARLADRMVRDWCERRSESTDGTVGWERDGEWIVIRTSPGAPSDSRAVARVRPAPQPGGAWRLESADDAGTWHTHEASVPLHSLRDVLAELERDDESFHWG
jgi:hypothetical protein